MSKPIIEKVGELTKKQIDKIPAINRGGCGVVAMHLYKVIQKLGLSPTVYLLTYDIDRLEKYLKMEDTNPYKVSIAHLIVEAGGKYIDSTGAHNTIEELKNGRYVGSVIFKGFPIETLELLTGKPNIWCSMFDRDRYTQYIEMSFDRILKKLTK